MEPKATINDIANHAEVSPSLVSMVINNYPHVSLDKIKRVNKAMKELNYKPAPPGRRQGQRSRSSKKRLTNRVAVFVFGGTVNMFATEIYMKTLNGIETSLRKNGKLLQIHFFADEKELKTNFLTSKVDGIILFNGGQIADVKCIQLLRQYPCVQVMGMEFRDDLWWDHVSYDDRRIGELGAEYLMGLGCSSFAVIDTDQPISRCTSCERKIKQAGKSVTKLRLIRFPDNDWAVPIDELTTLSPFPEGIFCSGDQVTADLYMRLNQKGYTPGKDCQVIGCDNTTNILNYLNPRPASIDIHPELVGEKAVDQLLWRINNPIPGKVKIALEPELVLPENNQRN